MDSEKRAFSLKILSCLDYDQLRELFKQTGLSAPEFEYLRKPETGLYMVRGRADGDGSRFNLGEVLVSRCAVKSERGFMGVSYVTGDSKDHCRFAAMLDAMLQDEKRYPGLYESIISKGQTILEDKKTLESEKTDKTRVEFFTMG